MQCSRCKSERIQRDFDEASAFLRLAGMRKLLCNDCGNIFLGFDPMGKVRRTAAKRDPRQANRRRSPRFKTHLPTSICLAEKGATEYNFAFSPPSQGHCEAINEHGMGLSLVGSKFTEADLTRKGRFLMVRIRLPETTVEAIVSVLNHRRFLENKGKKWFLGVQIHQMSDTDKANLNSYLKKREMKDPLHSLSE